MRDRLDRKRAFIHQLAVYLVDRQAEMSVLLQMGKREALAWRDLRVETPLRGYPTVEEAEQTLLEFLG